MPGSFTQMHNDHLDPDRHLNRCPEETGQDPDDLSSQPPPEGECPRCGNPLEENAEGCLCGFSQGRTEDF